jgi:gamma-glutamyl-gamma-aminobutyrate hydrolase PuuD
MQRSDENKLPSITQSELIELMERNIKSGLFNKPYNFDLILKSEGFNLKLIDIDYEFIRAQLQQKGLHIMVRKAELNGSFSNIQFLNCKKIIIAPNTTLSQCEFEQCSIFNSIENCNLINCNFKHVEFNGTPISNCNFKNVSMENCELIDANFKNIFLINSHVTKCKMIRSQWENISGLVKDEYSENNIDFNSSFINTAWEEQDALKNISDDKPIVIMLYSVTDGVTNARKMINFYDKYGINLILIDPIINVKHPLFKQSALISGIILPGGPDIPEDDNDVRKKFEITLLNLACENKIPMLGICRGHQLIGSRFGGTIRTMDSHIENIMHVKPRQDSLIYQRLKQKHEKFKSKETNAPESTYLDVDEKGKFTYLSVCAHSQALFFDKSRNKDQVKIVAKASDGTPEALEINGHILTYQHHHETYLFKNTPESGKIAKALLKLFATKVIVYEKENHNMLHTKGINFNNQ